MEKNDTSEQKYFDDAFNKEYELALRIGKKRFGTPCPHEQIRNGYCVKCLRKVIKIR